jgi:hypothetical protein
MFDPASLVTDVTDNGDANKATQDPMVVYAYSHVSNLSDSSGSGLTLLSGKSSFVQPISTDNSTRTESLVDTGIPAM